MCGFFAFAPNLTGSEINDVLGLNESNKTISQMASYKFSPKSIVPTVSRNSPNKLVMRMWGLIPRWWREDPMKVKFATFNARSEDIESKATYRAAWNARQRCLIPSSWFYEFETVRDAKDKVLRKLPYRVQSRGEDIMGIAGLYEVWKDAEGKEIESCTMLTRGSNEPLNKIHKRQPVILRKTDWDNWLDRELSPEKAKNLLNVEANLEMFPIDPEFNKTSAEKIKKAMVGRRS